MVTSPFKGPTNPVISHRDSLWMGKTRRGASRLLRWAVAVLSVALWATAEAPAALLNPGFEDGGGSLVSWTTFNNVIPNVLAAPITPRSGTHVAKVFGAFSGTTNWSGIYQSLPATPGQVWTAECYVRHNAGDALAGANQLLVKIEFYGVAGGVWGSSDFLGETVLPVLDSASPLNTWLGRSVQAVAPTATVEARIAFVFTQEGDAAGAALIDDVAFSADGEPPVLDAWRLLWHDEFENSAVDPGKWRIEDLHLIKNNELQYYAPDEVYVENGDLVLRSRKRTYWGFDSNGDWGRYDYTSGLVETRNRFAHTFGRIEVRAILPWTQGMWPAHWMLPSSGAWPPEIDIMEMLGHAPQAVYMTHHWGTWPDVQSDGGVYIGPVFAADYHTFGLEWQPGRLDWYVDGQVRFTSQTEVPTQPFYLILNTAVGGTWPGNPDGTTVFPQYHRIDYARWFVPGVGGDITGDNVVNDADIAAFGDCVAGPDEPPSPVSGIHSVACTTTFDLDGDGDVDLADYAALQALYAD